jgi:hypothetical protein
MKTEKEGALSASSRQDTRLWIKRSGIGAIKSWSNLLQIDYMTVWGWLKYGHVPNREHEKTIREKTPNCPLLKELG